MNKSAQTYEMMEAVDSVYNQAVKDSFTTPVTEDDPAYNAFSVAHKMATGELAQGEYPSTQVLDELIWAYTKQFLSLNPIEFGKYVALRDILRDDNADLGVKEQADVLRRVLNGFKAHFEYLLGGELSDEQAKSASQKLGKVNDYLASGNLEHDARDLIVLKDDILNEDAKRR